MLKVNAELFAVITDAVRLASEHNWDAVRSLDGEQAFRQLVVEIAEQAILHATGSGYTYTQSDLDALAAKFGA